MKILFRKKQNELAKRVVANYLIAKDGLNRAQTTYLLNLNEWNDAIQQLTDNTIELLTELVDISGLKYYTNLYGLGGSQRTER